MKHCPQTALATATARAATLEHDAAGVLARLAPTALNHAFFAQRLTALRGVHRRQVARLQDAVKPAFH